MDTIVLVTFWFSSVFIGPLWFMMWFFPRHDITMKYVGNLRLVVAPLVISYGILLAPNLLEVLLTLGSQMPTPEIVLEMFSKDQMIMLAWLHFLVMDTFAGRYVWLRMLESDKPIQISLPILITCMMVGPLGLLLGILFTNDVNESFSVVGIGGENETQTMA